MPFARTRGGVIRLGDVFWGRVNLCRADCSVSFHVGGAAVALIIVGGGVRCLIATHISGGSCDVQTPRLTDIIIYVGGCRGGAGLRMNDNGRWRSACHDDLHLYYTHILPPSLGRWFSLCRR